MRVEVRPCEPFIKSAARPCPVKINVVASPLIWANLYSATAVSSPCRDYLYAFHCQHHTALIDGLNYTLYYGCKLFHDLLELLDRPGLGGLMFT